MLLSKAFVKGRLYYYLPGGHIEHGEGAEGALIRELEEEIEHTFTIQRFLGCFEYSFIPTPTVPNCHDHEYNFIFQVSSPTYKKGMLPGKASLKEALEWLLLEQTSSVTFFPEGMDLLLSKWMVQDYKEAFSSRMVKP
jgi:8-oxo-dGTP diphosphatase